MKGTRVGGAAVSQEHGNFIITESGATARDVLELIGQIQTRAREKRGIDLQTEVQIIGH
jgi:UDP-N-acetylmuramate dehydrogenase